VPHLKAVARRAGPVGQALVAFCETDKGTHVRRDMESCQCNVCSQACIKHCT
jgi:hypothetical protein